MQTQIVTTITTTIDLNTFEPEHDVSIEAKDDLPVDLITAAVTGGCKATLKSLESKRPTVIRGAKP